MLTTKSVAQCFLYVEDALFGYKCGVKSVEDLICWIITTF